MGQPYFRYFALMAQERWFAVTVVGVGLLTVALVVAIVFWR
jgi:hypothetical protein